MDHVLVQMRTSQLKAEAESKGSDSLPDGYTSNSNKEVGLRAQDTHDDFVIVALKEKKISLLST